MSDGGEGSVDLSGDSEVCEAWLSFRALLLLAGGEGGSGRCPTDASSRIISL